MKSVIPVIPVIPDISKQIYKEDVSIALENKYSILGPLWVSFQFEWCNGVYASFKDHDKFLIIIYLIKKTLDFYSRNFTKLNYEQFYSKESVEIEKFNIMEISSFLNIPKESARRKVLELQKTDVIKKFKKKIIIDRSNFYIAKPVDSIRRISRFLSTLSEVCKNEDILLKKFSTEELENVIKNNFSYVWKIYYEMQIPMMISYKKIFKDLETFHIFATCIVSQHLYAKKVSRANMSRDDFIESMYAANEMTGINAMSISDITGIPRATVIRKLQKLVKEKNLSIDNKKHYRLTGNSVNKLKPLQKDILVKLSDFSVRIFNLALL
jgi:predicted transcriptional regulator